MRLNIIFILAILVLITGCAPGTSASQPRAIYLTNGPGVLPESELQVHPEVQVVSTLKEFQAAVQAKVALWIDKNAVDLVNADPGWLHQPPQKDYPLALVGYNDPLYSFRDVLLGFPIEGPYVDWSQETLEPGYSVWMILEEKEDGSHSSFFQGYPEEPTVEDILAVTDELLPQSLAK